MVESFLYPCGEVFRHAIFSMLPTFKKHTGKEEQDVTLVPRDFYRTQAGWSFLAAGNPN